MRNAITNPATIAVLIAFVVVMIAMAGVFMLSLVDKGEPRPPGYRFGPKR